MTTRARLFGRVELEIDGTRVPPLGSPRAEALLAHLLIRHGEPVQRKRIAELFWPDSTIAQSRTNLRHLVHTVRAILPAADPHLEVTKQTVRWYGDLDLDVERFDKSLAADDLETAADLYRGDLAESCGDALDHELAAERDRLRLQHTATLARLAEQHEQAGRWSDGIAVAERLLRADPLREQTSSLLMRMHAAQGDRARALGVYHDLCTTLDRELGVGPSPETLSGYAALVPPTPTTTEPGRTVRLVGRASERARLVEAWRAAESGRSGLVVIGGEPGVGKTRLAEEFRAWCARRGAVVADARCFATDTTLPYEPLLQLLRGPGMTARQRRLDPRRTAELSRLLPELPGTPDVVPPGEQRRRLLDAVTATLVDTGTPTLLLLDDLQHLDPDTAELLLRIIRNDPTAKLLLVATERTEETTEDHPARHLTAALRTTGQCLDLPLDPLDPTETALLAARLTPTPTPATERLYAATEGNPLFVVEAARAGWEALDQVGPRVQAVIEARLAPLSADARELVDVAALIGREFDVHVLQSATGIDEGRTVRALDDLWRRRIVRERGPALYDFTHDTLREVAARWIEPARRRTLHRRIATALADTGDQASARIAAHYASAGATTEAIAWYRQAAETAQQRQSSVRAVELLGLALAQHPDTPTELTIRTALLAPLASTHGYAGTELIHNQRLVRRLTTQAQLEPSPALLRSLAMTAGTASDFAEAARVGRQLAADDPVSVVESAFLIGVSTFWAADFETAREHLQVAVDRYRPADRPDHLLHYGNDPKVACLARLGNTHWFLGDAGAAFAARDAALDWADQIAHPYSSGIARWFGALLALDAGDEQRLRADTEALAGLAWSPQLELGHAALLGYFGVRQGSRGIETIRTAIDRATGRGTAPGLVASLYRILLAAGLAHEDPPTIKTAATHLLEAGDGGRVWATTATQALTTL